MDPDDEYGAAAAGGGDDFGGARPPDDGPDSTDDEGGYYAQQGGDDSDEDVGKRLENFDFDNMGAGGGSSLWADASAAAPGASVEEQEEDDRVPVPAPSVKKVSVAPVASSTQWDDDAIPEGEYGTGHADDEDDIDPRKYGDAAPGAAQPSPTVDEEDEEEEGLLDEVDPEQQAEEEAELLARLRSKKHGGGKNEVWAIGQGAAKSPLKRERPRANQTAAAQVEPTPTSIEPRQTKKSAVGGKATLKVAATKPRVKPKAKPTAKTAAAAAPAAAPASARGKRPPAETAAAAAATGDAAVWKAKYEEAMDRLRQTKVDLQRSRQQVLMLGGDPADAAAAAAGAGGSMGSASPGACGNLGLGLPSENLGEDAGLVSKLRSRVGDLSKRARGLNVTCEAQKSKIKQLEKEIVEMRRIKSGERGLDVHGRPLAGATSSAATKEAKETAKSHQQTAWEEKQEDVQFKRKYTEAVQHTTEARNEALQAKTAVKKMRKVLLREFGNDEAAVDSAIKRADDPNYGFELQGRAKETEVLKRKVVELKRKLSAAQQAQSAQGGGLGVDESGWHNAGETSTLGGGDSDSNIAGHVPSSKTKVIGQLAEHNRRQLQELQAEKSAFQEEVKQARTKMEGLRCRNQTLEKEVRAAKVQVVKMTRKSDADDSLITNLRSLVESGAAAGAAAGGAGTVVSHSHQSTRQSDSSVAARYESEIVSLRDQLTKQAQMLRVLQGRKGVAG